MPDEPTRTGLAVRVRPARWPDDESAIRAIREAVFVVEQGVPAELEWDGRDAHCAQVLALDSRGNPIGTARMLPDGHIGRMAVLAPWRGQGVGRALLGKLLRLAAAQDLEKVWLHAQTRAADFYRRQGFRVVGESFEEAGIPHVAMILHILDRDTRNTFPP
jgi:predicted GNAT family N-acyltransferase